VEEADVELVHAADVVVAASLGHEVIAEEGLVPELASRPLVSEERALEPLGECLGDDRGVIRHGAERGSAVARGE
jgi:hypothetical protein